MVSGGSVGECDCKVMVIVMVMGSTGCRRLWLLLDGDGVGECDCSGW